jgi:hypothetical protein
MDYEKFFEDGKKLGNALNRKGIGITAHAVELKNFANANDKIDFIHYLLTLYLDTDIPCDTVLIEILKETLELKEYAFSFIAGFISYDRVIADEGWITLQKAAELWNKNDSTLRRVIKGPNFTEGIDYKKQGRDWLIQKSAMERVYGKIE